MDFDKCDEDGFEGEQPYYQINQPPSHLNPQNFVHFDNSSLIENDQYPPEEVIFINDSQLHTYIINNRQQRDPLQQQNKQPSNSNMLFYPNVGINKQMEGGDDGANMGNDRSQNKENNTELNENLNNDTIVNDDVDDDGEVLIYDTQL